MIHSIDGNIGLLDRRPAGTPLRGAAEGWPGAVLRRRFVDILAEDVAVDANILHFSVKSRAADAESLGDHGHAAEMVDVRKQRKVAKVAMHYIGLRDPVFAKSRFDVVAITGDEEVLIQDAWRL